MFNKLLYFFLILKPLILDVVSAEKSNNNQENNEDHTLAQKSYRRFHEDMDDKEWHLSHLKETGFFRRNQCPEDTMEDKIKRYRNTLKRDGALVQYVYADPLPFDASDLNKSDTCTSSNVTDLFNTKADVNSKINKTSTKNDNTAIPGEVNSATTVPSKTKGFKTNMTGAKRRRGDYAFSSVEYYDEVPNFDEESCPHIVQVITLELDQLRNYDVECEMIIEWRSLDN